MKIKIECACGLHYEFEVVQVNERMPMPVSCPGCGAGGTAQANVLIRQQLAASARPRVPNPYARLAIFAAAAVVLCAWGFYRLYLSQPRPVYSQKIPKDQQRVAYQMISPTEILSVGADQVRLFDLKQGRQRWAAAFKIARSRSDSSEPAAIRTPKAVADDAEPDTDPDNPDDPTQFPGPDFEGYDGEFFSNRVDVQAGATGLWLISRGRLVQFDRRTGERKEDIQLPPRVLSLHHGANSLVAISAPDEDRRVLTRVSFADGDVQTEDVKLESPPPTDELRNELLPADPTVVQMKVRLLEERLVTYEAMSAKKGPTKVDSGNLTSGQSVEAALEQVNEMTRYSTGGKAQEDQSRYQVTLHRWLAKDAPDWTGEIIGPPAFHALKTVDVVTGVRSVTVFDKASKKLWESKLTHPFSGGPSFGLRFAIHDPEKNTRFVEHGDDLYVTDAGTLTRFNLKTGEAKWRLTSVGISKVLIDGSGQLYLSSTTASPDTIQHWQDVRIGNEPKPVILKVDAATGKPLWQVEGVGDKIALSGKYLYTSRAAMDKFAMLEPTEPEMHFYLYRINPSNGGTLWRHYENRVPRRMDFEGRQIMLHFKDEWKVLSYFSL